MIRRLGREIVVIQRIPLGAIPASDEDAEGVATNEPQITRQSSQLAGAHGQGPRDYNVLNGFLQQVSKAVEACFTNDPRPLILATLEEYRGALAEHMKTIKVMAGVVSGSPSERSPKQLHGKAWPIAAAEGQRRHEATLDRLSEALGTGRVGTLVLAERTLTEDARADDLDAASANTLVSHDRIDVVVKLQGNHTSGTTFQY